MSSFEAMAAGLVLLVSDSTSVAEALHDGEEALFFPPGDHEAISTHIINLLKNPAQYKEIAEKGQEFVREQLSWDNYIGEFMRAAMPRV